MRLFGRKLVTLLLIALMTMPVMSSPVLRHRHADGDTPHRHHVAKAEHREESHARGHKHSHSSRHSHRVDALAAKDSHDVHAAVLAKSSVEHFHVFWLGFQGFLPLPTSDQSDSPRPMANADQWVPLIPEVNLPSADRAASNLLTPDDFLPTELTPRLPARSVPRPPQPSAALLLCDTARHERSGVLVI